MIQLITAIVNASRIAFQYYTSVRHQINTISKKIEKIDKEISINGELMKARMLNDEDVRVLFNRNTQLLVLRNKLMKDIERLMKTADINNIPVIEEKEDKNTSKEYIDKLKAKLNV
jgi:hypothetical protein